MPTVVITGCNRGIGLEFARQYAQGGWRVIAAVRDAARAPQALTGLPGITVESLDVSDPAAIRAFGQRLAGQPVDLLIHNAGTYGGDRTAQEFGSVDAAAWLDTFRINTIAPLLLTEALAPCLDAAPAAKVAILTSQMGSVADNTSGGAVIYRSSKAAVNMVGKTLGLDLVARGISVVLLHPGWVKTDMGGPNALITTEESVTGLRQVIDGLSIETTGRFFDYSGKEIPW